MPKYMIKIKKNMIIKVFKLMSKVNETRFSVQHEPRECKCRLNGNACNSKQKWNHEKCPCEFKKFK